MGANYIGSDVILGLDQILGDDEEIGADELEALLSGDDDEFGADRKRSAIARLAAAQLRQQKRVVHKRADMMLSQIMPLPIVTVASAATEEVAATPQFTIRIERLVIPSWIARYFDVTQFNVGQQPQYVNTGSVNGAVFSEVAIGVRLKGDTANLGNKVSLSVQNISGGSLDFRGTIFGSTLK
jgi:hypothetical protein